MKAILKKEIEFPKSSSIFSKGSLFINKLGSKLVIVTKTSTNNEDTFKATVLFEKDGLLPDDLNDTFFKKDYELYIGEITLKSN